MLCPYCQKEHSEGERVCPNTGLPLDNQLVCQECGQEARPGARYCASCGASLPRTQSPIREKTYLSPSETSAAAPPGSQGYTRPSVSLVELSRRKTQASQTALARSTQGFRQIAQQSKTWRVIAYALLIIVLLAGAAGLYLIWIQLR